MCATCGCSDAATTVHTVGHTHGHGHTHDHGPGHSHSPRETRLVELEQDILAKNDHLAGHNREWLQERGILAVNLMSSPGSGKTTLLERTIHDVGAELGVSVIEGDQETLLDGERIRSAGAAAVQVNTGSGCHLDAEMLRRGLDELGPADRTVVMIENVGNLVCPALFDLGERARVVIMSVTEGADKPLKYPHMFRAADLMIVNKIDLAPYVDFDVDTCVKHARTVHPGLESMTVSATRGDGIEQWYDWLRARTS